MRRSLCILVAQLQDLPQLSGPRAEFSFQVFGGGLGKNVIKSRFSSWETKWSIRCGGSGAALVIGITGDYAGWLPKDAWE
jgi:hypothetical protein